VGDLPRDKDSNEGRMDLTGGKPKTSTKKKMTNDYYDRTIRTTPLGKIDPPRCIR
jgi:hypothetical protein